jgi:endoglucanase
VTVSGQGQDGQVVEDRAWSVKITNTSVVNLGSPTSTALPLRSSTATSTATVLPSASPTLTVTVMPTVSATPAPIQPLSGGAKSYGVNLAGAEFGADRLPGTLGVDYVYPTESWRNSYFASKGQRLVRLPIQWERVQPQAGGSLSAVDVAEIRRVLDSAQSAGQQVIIDLHNYGRYYGSPLTTSDGPKFANLWEQLARALSDHPALYGYELMNEPHDLPGNGPAWATLAQIGTDAVRRADQRAWVLVPGYSWQSARFWRDNNESLAINDPAGKVLYAAHQYGDANYTGTYQNGYDALSATEYAERLQPFLDWLAAKNARGIVTEYGVPDNDTRWLEVLDRVSATLEANPRIVGATYWAAGPRWGSYSLSVEPRNGQDRPQMSVLSRYPSHS